MNKVDLSVKNKFLVRENISVKEAMVLMDSNGEKALFVIDNSFRLLGSLTDGDIRRFILSKGSLNRKIKTIYNRHPKSMKAGSSPEAIKSLMLQAKIEWVPLVNEEGQVVEILVWDKVFGDGKKSIKSKLDIPAVIMAGGAGTRLDPFTAILPKPLIPIKGTPIIELIMEKLNQYGITNFYISINYKSRIIRAYFEEANLNYTINYITEDKPLGTAGCLGCLAGKVKGPLLVTNCDTIINCDYGDLLEYYQKNKNDITLVGSLRNFVIPYGICDITSGGILKKIKEKPNYDLLINTGMYIINSDILKLIPANMKFQMTDLIEKVREKGGKIGVFPVSDNSWIDIGQWEEYRRTLKLLEDV